MCHVPVFYATSEGHTRAIAERIARRVREHGLDSRAIAIISEEASHLEWRRIRGACIAASIHVGKHQAEARAFARLNHARLSETASLFVSVSLSAASTNPAEVRAAQQLAERLPADAGWQPTRIASVAGRLAYTQYNWLVRLIMRRIAKKEGASTDTSRDHVYTNWQQVDEIADQLATAVLARGKVRDARGFSLRAAS
jgi:menaquinone-dependent protoporphyrinogen oxidase